MTLLTFLSEVYAKESIIWIEHDFPPVSILEGPLKGSGGADLIQQLLVENLAEYDHKKSRVNISRYQVMMKAYKNVCDCVTFKTDEREKYMHFSSIPASFIRSNGIIIRSANIEQFRSASLTDIINNRSLILGIAQNRTFSKEIDQILDSNKDKNHIINRASSDITKGLISMLLMNRIDYFLGYDWELKYLLKRYWSPEIAKELIFIPIKETNAYSVSYVSCSKTDFGKEVIEKINKILKKEISKDEYRELWGQWMLDNKLYNKLYNEIYLKQYINLSNP